MGENGDIDRSAIPVRDDHSFGSDAPAIESLSGGIRRLAAIDVKDRMLFLVALDIGDSHGRRTRQSAGVDAIFPTARPCAAGFVQENSGERPAVVVMTCERHALP